MVHRWFSGLTLIALGTLTLLQVMGMYNFGLSLWPAVIVWIGLEIVWGSIFEHWHGPSLVGSAVGLFVAGLGLVPILANAGVPVALTTTQWLMIGWPALLVALGLGLLFRPRHRNWPWRWENHKNRHTV